MYFPWEPEIFDFTLLVLVLLLKGDRAISPAVCSVFLSYSGRNVAATLYFSWIPGVSRINIHLAFAIILGLLIGLVPVTL